MRFRQSRARSERRGTPLPAGDARDRRRHRRRSPSPWRQAPVGEAALRRSWHQPCHRQACAACARRRRSDRSICGKRLVRGEQPPQRAPESTAQLLGDGASPRAGAHRTCARNVRAPVLARRGGAAPDRSRDELFEIERLRLLEGVPVAIDRSRVTLARCPQLVDVEFAIDSLYDTLEESGVVPTNADFTVESAPRRSEQRAPRRRAGLAASRCPSAHVRPEGPALQLGLMVYRGDRYRFQGPSLAMSARNGNLALGIDVGTTNVKAALVEPGTPPRVLTPRVGAAPDETAQTRVERAGPGFLVGRCSRCTRRTRT